ncbi:MAG: hypothetical protein A2Y62_03235 [Candidatus Fischerbacteria bacterium RBG_13_37_8]|uniref:TonB C-terminal domain-containing protein n=1 Tax=Candidatus Fischerbacteria bacterium RBG_13_37_8 TaxID=1817863 RepID=A0A1F5VUT3_9BACT|nr:MAG: hypothetical protein A2Y62_03235 [Candidatus Fischerbacteria bacterium RBG_13_37_8]
MYSPSAEVIPLPDEIKQILKKLLSDIPDQRYGTSEEVRQLLDEYLFSSEYQPSTFNLAFYMNGLYRDDAITLQKMIEEAEKMELTSYFIVQVPEDKGEISLIETLQEEEEEVIELEESPAEVTYEPEKPVTPASVKMPSLATPPPVKRSFMLPIIIAVLIVIIGVSTMYLLLFSGKLSKKTTPAPPAVAQQTDLKERLSEEQRKREEIEKKYEEDMLALQQKLEEVQGKLDHQLTESEKTKAINDLKKLQEMQKQKDETFTKEIASLSQTPAGGEKPADTAPDKEEQPIVTGTKPSDVKTKPAETEKKPFEKIATEEKPALPQNVPIADSSKNVTSPVVDKTVTTDQERTDTISPGTNQKESSGNIPAATPEESKPKIPANLMPPKIAYVNELDSPLKVLKEVKPDYPIIARKQKASGLVIVSIVVGKDGKVEMASVLKGHPLLNDAAVDAAKKTVYSIPKINGVPVKTQLTKVYNFKQ